MDHHQEAKLFKEHLPLLIALALGILLLFPNLGDRMATGDEAYTLIQAKTVLGHGYPYPFYRNFEILPKATYQLGSILLFNWTPWLESYIAAAMEAVAGFSEFWLRFPFALFGLATIALTYVFARKLLSGRFALTMALLLLVTSVTFLLHARQARWYVLSMFFALATWHAYWCWIREGRSVWWLSLTAVLLFHSQIYTFAAVLFSLAAHFVLFERKRCTLSWLRKNALPLVAILMATAPWFVLTGQLAGKAGGITLSPLRFGLGIALYSYYTAVLLVPLVVVIPGLIMVLRKEGWSEQRKFIATILLGSFLFLPVKGDLLPAVRYLVFLIPLLSIVTAEALAVVRRKSVFIALVLAVVIGTTNVIHIAPLIPFRPLLDAVTVGKAQELESEFIDQSLAPRAYFPEYLYEVTHHTTSAEEEIIRVMSEDGSPGDTFITSNFAHVILVYTNMDVGLPDARAESYYKMTGQQPPNRVPEWIIPRGFRFERAETDAFIREADATYNLSRYRQVAIDINDEERWASSPDPINHKFKTDTSRTLTIYHRP